MWYYTLYPKTTGLSISKLFKFEYLLNLLLIVIFLTKSVVFWRWCLCEFYILLGVCCIVSKIMVYRGVGNINNYAVINNRNTPYFNHTRSTVNKVSTNFTDCKTRVLAYSVASCTSVVYHWYLTNIRNSIITFKSIIMYLLQFINKVVIRLHINDTIH